MTPAVIAVAAPTPKRWKKRTLIATRAAVLGMARFTYVMANCRETSGPSGSGLAIEPMVLKAEATRGSCARTTAKASHHQLASFNSCANDSRSRSPSSPISVNAAIASRATLIERAPRHPAQADQRLVGRAEVLGEPHAHLVEVDVSVLEDSAKARGHGGVLQVRQHLGQRLGTDGRAGDGECPLLAERGDGQRQHLRLVLELAGRRSGDGGRRQITEAERPVGMPHDPVEIDLSVGDAGVVQQRQLRPQRGEARLVNGSEPGRIAERCADRADDDERIAAPGAARRHEVRDAGTRPLGEHRHEPLVLDQLEARVLSEAFGVAIPHEPPHGGEQLSVPRVAAVHLDQQRPVRVVTIEEHGTVRLHRCRCEVVDVHAQLLQRQPDARRVRASARRAEGEVHTSSSEQSDGDSGDRTESDGRAEATTATACPNNSHRPRWRNGRVRCGDAVENAAAVNVTRPGGNAGGSSSSNRPLSTPSVIDDDLTGDHGDGSAEGAPNRRSRTRRCGDVRPR